MKKGVVIALAVVLALLICVEGFLFFRMRSQADGAVAAESLRTESPAVTQAPPPTAEPVTPTPEPTPEPATPTPEPTAEPVTPTPEPTPVPATPTPKETSGSFKSDTGVGLNMVVDWKTEDLGNGTTRVDVTGKIKSYSLNVGRTSVTVTMGDKTVTCEAPSFNIGQGSEVTSDLFSTSLEVPSGTTSELVVEWGSKVTYSGVSLSTITAKGNVTT